MAFQYSNAGGYNPQPTLSYENPYMQQQQQQQEGGGDGMMQMLKQANEIWGGGGEAAGGDLMGGGIGGAQSMGGGVGSIQSGGALGSQGGGMMVGNAGGGMGAGAGGGGWQGAAAAGGPWALLAAAVIGTEISGKDEGRRGDDTNDWIRHSFGKGLSRDTQYMNEKMWGDDLRNDKLGIGADQNMVTDLMSGDFSNAWDWAKQGSFMKPLKWIEDIWD